MWRVLMFVAVRLLDARCRSHAAAFVGLLAVVSVTAIQAEVIHIPVGQQAPENRDLPRPQRGQSQESVLARFGEPISIAAAVGEPPISKWVYADFTVYFESATVIHSVLTHKPKHPLSGTEADTD